MAMTAEDWQVIDRTLMAASMEASTIADLRRQFPQLSWTSCDASDVMEKPYRVYEKFEVHLLNTANHCAEITSDPANATGIILACRTLSS
jgi:hypothetical protein